MFSKESLMSKCSVCIVTPDIVGPIKNGGIGTHCYFLAKTLAKEGYKVSVLFTGPLQNGTHSSWEAYYKKLDISYFHLDDVKKVEYDFHCDEFTKISYLVYNFLKDRKFDIVHFQDWLANGLVAIQSKETTSQFDSTALGITLHSPTQWQQEGMREFSQNPIYNAKLKWAEEYCAKMCDFIVSPSQHMYDWTAKHSWKINNDRYLLPYCYEQTPNSNHKHISVDTKHIIFFGRLETRKGLKYFCDSILPIKDKLGKVSFIGKISTCEGTQSDIYIKDKLEGEIEYSIYDTFDTFESMEFIKSSKGVVVLPSLLDNYPYTVIESIANHVPFLCSNVGGIPEMADKKVVFDIDSKNSLSDLILSINDSFFARLHHKHDIKIANKNWVNLHNTFVLKKPKKRSYKEPLVSICIPYFEYPDYLPTLLASISKLEYENYEVIVVNDGSKSEEAKQVFDKMKNRYTSFYFISKQNGGVGETRNFAAKRAKGDFLLFVDADNVVKPSMVKDFIFAMQKTDADCITCYFDGFDEKDEDISPSKLLYRYLPLGQIKEVGMVENVFGDANFIVKKEVFDELGGFSEKRKTSWEDWEFLAKLSLEGYVQKVLPKSLFFYRHTEAGFSRITNLYKNQEKISNLYCEYYPKEIQRLIANITIPMYHQKQTFQTRKIVEVIDKLLPPDSKRKKLLKKLLKGFIK